MKMSEYLLIAFLCYDLQPSGHAGRTPEGSVVKMFRVRFDPIT